MKEQPKVTVSVDDIRRLNAVLDSLPASAAVERLIDELARADVVDTDKLPTGVVAMHSKVNFTVLTTQKTFTYKLVYPHEATTEDTLSILTPVGSALLGLSVGQEIEWPLDGTKSTRVRINAIPE